MIGLGSGGNGLDLGQRGDGIDGEDEDSQRHGEVYDGEVAAMEARGGGTERG